MHINLIKFFLQQRSDWIAYRSFINCHCKGLDSILFDDTEGARIRMFIANENHELWKNKVPFNTPMSLAFHGHHCDLELHALWGGFTNIRVSETGDFLRKEDIIKIQTKKYLYNSKITKGDCKFEDLGDQELFYVCGRYFCPSPNGSYISLDSKTLHTVHVEKNAQAAWIVYEGKEDPAYLPVCYSNRDLTKFDDSALYQPMSRDYLYAALRKIYPEL